MQGKPAHFPAWIMRGFPAATARRLGMRGISRRIAPALYRTERRRLPRHSRQHCRWRHSLLSVGLGMFLLSLDKSGEARLSCREWEYVLIHKAIPEGVGLNGWSIWLDPPPCRGCRACWRPLAGAASAESAQALLALTARCQPWRQVATMAGSSEGLKSGDPVSTGSGWRQYPSSNRRPRPAR